MAPKASRKRHGSSLGVAVRSLARDLYGTGARGSRCGTSARTSISPCGSNTWDSLAGLRRAKARALALCGTRRPSASHHTRSTCSFSSPSPTATSDRCAISTPVPRGKRNAGSRAEGMWRCCVSTRGSGGERRAWPRVVRSGYSSGRQVCSAVRAICRFLRSRLRDRVPDGMGIR